MGIIARAPSDEAECWCFKSLSLSRELSRSVEGMVVKIQLVWNAEWNVVSGTVGQVLATMREDLKL